MISSAMIAIVSEFSRNTGAPQWGNRFRPTFSPNNLSPHHSTSISSRNWNSKMTHDVSIDKILAAMPSSAAGPSRKPQKDVTVADFEKILDTTPLFMRETPANGEDNEVLEALRSLVFEGEGDGELHLRHSSHHDAWLPRI